MDKVEIDYNIDDLTERTLLVESPNLEISVGVVITIFLGANVLSIANYERVGTICLDQGNIIINNEQMGHRLGNISIQQPVRFLDGVNRAKLE